MFISPKCSILLFWYYLVKKHPLTRHLLNFEFYKIHNHGIEYFSKYMTIKEYILDISFISVAIKIHK